MAVASQPPSTRRFTADEVWRMVEAGVLGEDEPYELIHGELRYVSPQGPPHAGSIGRITMALAPVYAAAGYVVRVQTPLGGILDSIPEPDLAVVAAEHNDADTHPRPDQTLLIVEISNTSRQYDIAKGPIYAEHGAPAYWRIDIPTRSATLHTGPRPDGTWAAVRTVTAGESLALPGVDATVPLEVILPRG